MIPANAHDRRLSPPRQPALGADRLNVVVALTLMAVVLGLAAYALARGQQIVALALTILATVCITAIARPRAYRIVALVALLAVPVASAMPFLRPQEYDYFVYVGGFSLLLVGLGIFQPVPFPPTLGTAYLSYVLIAGSIAAGLTLGLQDGSRAVSTLTASFAVYVLVSRSDAFERRLLLGGLFVLGVIESVIAVLQVLTGWPVFSAVLPTLFVSNRNYIAYFLPGASAQVTLASGTFYHFNLLGSTLALMLPIAFALWLERPRRLWRALLFGLLASGTVATFSRGALLSATIAMVYLLMSEHRRGRQQASAVIGSALAVVAMLALNVVTRYVEASGNISARRSTWSFALNDALERPSNLLVGYGFKHFSSAVLSAGDVMRALHTHVLTYLHSGVLQLLLEFGIVGLVLFVLWLAIAFDRSQPHQDSFLVRGLVAGTLAFVIYQTVENILFAYPGVLFVAVVACLEAECSRRPSGR